MYTYNRRRALLIVVAAAWLLACLPAGLAGPVPGDPNPVQTTGMCFATYGFTVNTTTYSNVTLDVRSMSVSDTAATTAQPPEGHPPQSKICKAQWRSA